MTLPGDELVRGPAVQTTEAVSIDAPAGSLWPWSVQIGQDRGYLYSFEALENLAGRQRLDVGDVVRLAPKGWMGLRDGVALCVADVVPEKRIVLRAAPAALPWEVLAVGLAGPVTALLTRAMLNGIKRRAETQRDREPSPITDLAR